jgi:hypothetical protein
LGSPLELFNHGGADVIVFIALSMLVRIDIRLKMEVSEFFVRDKETFDSMF